MIEKTKRPSYILTWFIFSTVIMVVFLSFLVFFIYPKINEINLQKIDTKTKVENYENLKKKWITFEEFTELKRSYKTDLYNISLLQKINKTFFGTYFTNNKSWEDFNTFFTKKINEINKLQDNENFKKAQESYKNILPTYVEDNYENENADGVMTDFKFVTYIESILYTFNLDIPNKNLNVWNLNVLPDYGNDNATPLDTTIFYIPYKFDVTWKKSDVLDFIYFLENVGSIKINTEWNVEVQDDNFIKKALLGFDNWKIFENQIIDIEKIQITDYIDSWLQDKEKNETLMDYIKRTQWGEKVTISIDVRFYVKWVPNYKIMESIEKLDTRYKAIKEEYGKLKNDKNLTEDEKIILDKWLAYLKELDASILTIKKEKTDLNKTYKKVLEVNKLLDILQDTLKKQ